MERERWGEDEAKEEKGGHTHRERGRERQRERWEADEAGGSRDATRVARRTSCTCFSQWPNSFAHHVDRHHLLDGASIFRGG